MIFSKKLTILFFSIAAIVFCLLFSYYNSDVFTSLYIALSVPTFLLFGYDKYAAMNSLQRVAELTFLFLTAIGLGPAIVLGMLTFRHKIRDKTFVPKLVVIAVLQLFVIAYSVWEY